MSNIDLSQLITAADKADENIRRLAAARKSECRARILLVVDETAQINLAAAAAAGALDAGQMVIYRAGLGWIHAMRAVVTAGGDWPDVPEGVAELAQQF